jgi:luciferase family oxidoreductase group 1
VARHHAAASLACAAPEVLIPAIASATTRIRVGSGGIMLPHYSPVKVAECFSMLAGLFPDRVDLGIGRAAGTDARTAFALQRDRRQQSPDDFVDQLDELLALIEDRMPPEHPFAPLANLPGRPFAPVPYLLGSSPQSGLWAAQLGMPYVFADFINPMGVAIASQYRASFKPSHRLTSPRTFVAAWVICADTDDEARRQAAPHRMMIELLQRGRLIAVPTVERALAYLRETNQPLAGMPMGRRTIVGSPDTVRAGLEQLVAAYQAEEALVVAITHSHAVRRRSYELLAEAFDLTGSDWSDQTVGTPGTAVRAAAGAAVPAGAAT